MKNCKTILTEKQQNISALSSWKIDKYEYLAGEEILPFNQRTRTEQAKFTYSSLLKSIRKRKKNNLKNQGIKQLGALKAFKSEENQKLESTEGLYTKNMRTDEIKKGIGETGNWEEKNKWKDLKCKTNKDLYDF